MNSFGFNQSPPPSADENRGQRYSNNGMKSFGGNVWMGQGEGDQGPVNPCWNRASKLFKSPLHAPAIPLPENLLAHIEKKFPE